MSEKVQYWFNTQTNAVEVGPQSLSLYRIGPFESFAEAAMALKVVADKARRIREEDEQD